ncbi:MAG TPA: glycosyltransferase [Thermoleophilaceae bacterium]|jgi:glycosyltransferase involved in cell wall biosynthesis
MADARAARRPRVLMLVDSLYDGTGGAERFAVGLACALPRDRFEVSMCVTRTAEGYLPRQLAEAGVGLLVLGRRGRADVLRFRRLAAYLRRERVDVLHCHKFGSNVWGTVIGRACRVPVVVAHEHTWSYEGQPLRRLLDGFLIGRLASAFVSVSNADRERMIEIERVPARKTVTIPTGYVPRPDEAVGDLRGELGIPADAPTVGTIGQLRPQKALEVLIEAFAGVGDPSSHLIVVGDGPSREELERRADAAGVGERAHFLGTRVDLATVFGGLDVAAMSSDFEGLPLFAFECMAHRTPLVATRVGGLPDLVSDGSTGVLVPPRDPAALAVALRTLLADPGLRERMAAAAAERLPEFTMEAVAARFADLYDKLLACAGS